MLHERIRRQQQVDLLERLVAAMPEYPIYCEAPDRYSSYIEGRRRTFNDDVAARLAQLQARARWLYMRSDC